MAHAKLLFDIESRRTIVGGIRPELALGRLPTAAATASASSGKVDGTTWISLGALDVDTH